MANFSREVKPYFYPRSPCGERQQYKHHPNHEKEFLSTLSLRRATSAPRFTPAASRNFYPRSPCGERQARRDSRQHPAGISIHALLAESDFHLFASSGVDFAISIHALLAESDVKLLLQLMRVPLFLSTLSLRRATGPALARLASCLDFYPRSPCGERRVHYDNFNLHCCISIHALLAESDLLTLSMDVILILFLSTLSLRRATAKVRP